MWSYKKGHLLQITIDQKCLISVLSNLFNKYKNERILVLGTTCSGKSTLVEHFNDIDSVLKYNNYPDYLLINARDMDNELFPLITKEQTEYLCQSPWTGEICNLMHGLIENHIKTIPKKPLFGTDFIDCDVAILIKLDPIILSKRCKLRDVNLESSIKMHSRIEEEFLTKSKGKKSFIFTIIE